MWGLGWLVRAGRIKISRALLGAAVLLALAAFPGRAWAEQHFLWRVDFPEGRQAFIMGSIHLANADLYPLKPRLNEVFNQCAALVVEIDADQLAPKEMERFVAAHGYCWTCRPLPERLGPETRATLNSSGFYSAEMAAMQPWLAALFIQNKALAKQGFAMEYGLDRYFTNRARDRKIKILSLESLDEQMGMFAHLTEEESDIFLRSTLLEMENLPRVMSTFLESWQNGDVPRFAEAFWAEYEKYPTLRPLMDKIILRRNETMAEKIFTLAAREEGPLFIVVGAGHLVGGRSILSELAEKGCTLSQL